MPERQSSPGETTEERAADPAVGLPKGSDGASAPESALAGAIDRPAAGGDAAAPAASSADGTSPPTGNDAATAAPAGDTASGEPQQQASGATTPVPASRPTPRPRPAAQEQPPAAAEQPTSAQPSVGATEQPTSDQPPTGSTGQPTPDGPATPSASDSAGRPPAPPPVDEVAPASEPGGSPYGQDPDGTVRPTDRAPGSPAGAAAATGTDDDRPTSSWFSPRQPASEDTQVIPVTAPESAALEQPTQRLRPGSTPRAAAPGSAPAGTTADPTVGAGFTGFDPPTERIALQRPGQAPPHDEDGSKTDGRPKRRRRGLLIVAGVVGLLALLYFVDLVLSTGNVPRGVSVAGVQLGGLSKAEARQRLQTAIEPRTTQPVQLTAGSVQTRIDPKAAGLEVDYVATIDQAGRQPLNPVTRLTSFFTEREVDVVNRADARAVATALEQLKPVVDVAPKEGDVTFEGTTPVPVLPVPGQQLDLQAAAAILERDWASGSPVALPLVPQPTATTPEDVQQAITEVATPAVSAPLTVEGEGANATVTPADIAEALTFRADAAASPRLVPEINVEALKAAVSPQLKSTETPSRDASLDFSTGAPVVVPSQDGRGVDYDKTFQQVLPVLTGTGERKVVAVYADQRAELTTEEIAKLGITGEISSFTTGGFAADSGRNIKRAAEQINGTVVKPGETFSLNALTNPRNAANGYVEAGIIENGHAARGIGGGVSQVATTLYNAAYFAGMVDVEHKEHSFYISRYPAGREATVFDDVIDLKFRNDGPTGVLIQTYWTPSSITVKMFGTKRYEVTSETGPRTNFTEPQAITIPPGQSCTASAGAQGFTVTDTRVMRNLETGEVTRKTRTVKYNPSPKVACG